MKINDTLLMFWKLDASSLLSLWHSNDVDNTQYRADGGCLAKHYMADICDVTVLISADSLWKYEYSSDMAVFLRWPPSFQVPYNW